MSEKPEKHRSAFMEQTVIAKFFTSHITDAPYLVSIDGVVYRREDNQEEENAFLKEQELNIRLRERLDEEGQDLLFQFDCAVEAYHNILEEALRQNLLKSLPNYAPVIEHVFCPEEFHLDAYTTYQHSHCQLPAMQVNE